MSDVKKLIIGIVLVGIGIVALLSGAGVVPAVGAILGVIGAALILFVLTSGLFPW